AEVENYAGSSFSVFKQRFTGVTIRILDGFTLD
ncbi:hypothetical protein J2751_002387, partial [Halorubrum alkaliphilum]|nr:hypothetical protein [Halorubrum alkaliphilum]